MSQYICKCGADDAQLYTTPDGNHLDLCDECAVNAGFCPACREIVAGNEWHDRALSQYGICDECLDQLREETGEYDDEY